MNSPDGISGPVNIGDLVEFTIRDLANLVIKMPPSKSKLIFLTLPENDPVKRKSDIPLIMSLTEWEPVIELEAGLNETIDYFRKAM